MRLLRCIAIRDFHFEANLCQQVGFFLLRAIIAQVAHPVKLSDLLPSMSCWDRDFVSDCEGVVLSQDRKIGLALTLSTVKSLVGIVVQLYACSISTARPKICGLG
jgi:hypothetical protein